jgi:hypothetical protein
MVKFSNVRYQNLCKRTYTTAFTGFITERRNMAENIKTFKFYILGDQGENIHNIS